MAETFFMQAVSHALDRYNQRQMHEREVSSRETMAAADLKEKYYYAGIIKASNEREADLRSEQLGIAERAQRLQEDQANVNNEMVPLQNFKGVPGQIMRGFSPDGKNVRRGDVPAMMQSYVGWLNAVKMNQAESWRLGAMQKAEQQDTADRANLYALLNVSRAGAPSAVPTPEDQLKARKDAQYKGYKDTAYNILDADVGPFSLYKAPLLGPLLKGTSAELSAGIVSASDDAFKGQGVLQANERKVYSDALTQLGTELGQVNDVLDVFSDPRVNARITPHMVGVMENVLNKYSSTMPTLSRYADKAITNTLAQRAKRIKDVVDTLHYPDEWQMYLKTADDRIRADAQLERQRLANEGRR